MCGLGENQSAQARMSHYVGLELNSGHRLLPVACMGSLLGLRGRLLAQSARPAPRDGHCRSAFAWLCVNSGPAPLFCLPTAGKGLTESRGLCRLHIEQPSLWLGQKLELFYLSGRNSHLPVTLTM